MTGRLKSFIMQLKIKLKSIALILKKPFYKKIKVYIEQPIESGFCNATCILPEYKWQNINGFTQEQIADFQDMLEKGSHIIYKKSGLQNNN